MTSYKPVEATLRGLEVLQTVSRLESCTVKDIHAATGLNRATIVRMLETLMFAGYVYQEEQRGRYGLTAKVLRFSAGYRPATELAHRAGPILAQLQEAVGWPADVAIYDGLEMVTVATSPMSGRISLNQPAGYRANLFGTSLGLAYMAFASERERAIAIQALAANPAPWNDLARDPEQAAKTFARIRRRGYATIDRRASMASYHGTLQTIGVPVCVDGAAIASMNVIFLREAVSIRTAIQKFLPPLKAAADKLAAAAAPG